tara:strand:- start:184135 stop:185310 length:1176 start_codon:yes stop_codon:yes gene_type:complete
MYKVGDQFQITIEKMANRGKGLGRINDQVVFVPYSAPQDILTVKATKVSKNFIDAEIIEIVKPSDLRIVPACEYFSVCGGCHFQHLAYSTQVSIKDQLVKETLQRALGQIDESVFQSPIASPQEWHYRNRIQIHIENNDFGFIKRNSNTVVPIKNCKIAEPALNKALTDLKNSNSVKGAEKIELLIDKNLQVHQRDLNSQGQPVLFSQVNRFANQLLVDSVVDKIARFQPKSKVYDFYSGDGNFLSAISKKLPKNEVIGVELNPGLVRLGRKEIADQKLNAHYVQSTVENYLETVSISAGDTILLDPPRTGCDPKAMYVIGSAVRNKVVYVSCEPTTLARDLRLLKETGRKWGLSFRLETVQTLDMFPQTEHVETVVEFSIDKIDTLSTTH